MDEQECDELVQSCPVPTIELRVRSLFIKDNIKEAPQRSFSRERHRSRWGGANDHPVESAEVRLDGGRTDAVTDENGNCQIKLAKLPRNISRLVTIEIIPELAQRLRPNDMANLEPVGCGDGDNNDEIGHRRFRPLTLKVALEIGDSTAQVVDAYTENAWGNVAVYSTFTVLVDWKPDWIKSKLMNKPVRAIGSMTHVLLHRTGASEPGSSIDTFSGAAAEKGVHYLVDVDGHAVKMSKEDRKTAHAGSSWWRGQKDLNDTSVGIEQVNAGGPFTDEQYASVIRICSALARACTAIQQRNFVGHSDIRVVGSKDLALSTDRPECPGFFFNWGRLAAAGIGFYPRAAMIDVQVDYAGFFSKEGSVLSSATKGASEAILAVQEDLRTIGYSVSSADGTTLSGVYDNATATAVDRFKRHFIWDSSRQNPLLYPNLDRDTAARLRAVAAQAGVP